MASNLGFSNADYDSQLQKAMASGMSSEDVYSKAKALGIDANTVTQAYNRAGQGGNILKTAMGQGANLGDVAKWANDNGVDYQTLKTAGNAAGYADDDFNAGMTAGGLKGMPQNLNKQPPTAMASAAAAGGAGGPAMPGVNGVNYNSPYGAALQNQLSGSVNNPYMQQMANAITQNGAANFNNNVMPALRGGAQVAGQYGSSREGIAEGLAAKSYQQDMANQLSNLYGGAYESAQNRQLQAGSTLAGLDQQAQMANASNALQQQSINNQYGLGLGQLGLGQQQMAQQGQQFGQNLAFQQQQLGQQNQQFGQSQVQQQNQFGQQMGFNRDQMAQQNAQFMQGDATNRYASNNQLQGAQAGAGAQLGAAQAGAAASMANSQNSYNLGMANLGFNQAQFGQQTAYQNAMMPYQQAQMLYGLGSNLNNTDWSNIANLAGTVYPGANVGSGQTTTSNQHASGLFSSL